MHEHILFTYYAHSLCGVCLATFEESPDKKAENACECEHSLEVIIFVNHEDSVQLAGRHEEEQVIQVGVHGTHLGGLDNNL